MRLLVAMAFGGLMGCTVPGADGSCVPGTLCLGLTHVEDDGRPPSPASPLLADRSFIDPSGGWSLESGGELLWFERLSGDRIEGGRQFWYHQGDNFWASADGDLFVKFETQRAGLFWGQNEAQPIRMSLVSR